jgi:hypothetical protein
MQLNSSYSYKSTSAALEAPEPHIKQCDNNIGLCQPFQPFSVSILIYQSHLPDSSGWPRSRVWDLGIHAAGRAIPRFRHSASRETGSIVV